MSFLKIALPLLLIAGAYAHADTLTITQSGYPGNGVLTATFVLLPGSVNPYVASDTSSASATFTQGGSTVLSLDSTTLVSLDYFSSGYLDYNFQSGSSYISGYVNPIDGANGVVNVNGTEYFSGEDYSVTITATPVAATPEPSTLALLGTALVGGTGLTRRRFV